jgi:hypothetical protein
MKKAIKMSAGPTNSSVLINLDGRMPGWPGTTVVVPGAAVAELPVGGVTVGNP